MLRSRSTSSRSLTARRPPRTPTADRAVSETAGARTRRVVPGVPSPRLGVDCHWKPARRLVGAVQHLHEMDEAERSVGGPAWWSGSPTSPHPCRSLPSATSMSSPTRAWPSAQRHGSSWRSAQVTSRGPMRRTVAFFEAALWDHLGLHLRQHNDKRGWYAVDPPPEPGLVRLAGRAKGGPRPFKLVREADSMRWYTVFHDAACQRRLAKDYLKREQLQKLGEAVSKIQHLRNDVAHSEPTPCAYGRRTPADDGCQAVVV